MFNNTFMTLSGAILVAVGASIFSFGLVQAKHIESYSNGPNQAQPIPFQPQR